ncbi:MAG: DUF2752 domain-containing protein [Planctomycetaceae bacterium]
MVGSVWLLARSLTIEAPRTVVLPIWDYPLPELCHFRQFLGIDCPGCGMTRSFILASRFRIVDAWYMNPAGTMLFLSLIVSVPIRLFQWARVRQGAAAGSTLAIEAGWLATVATVMLLRWTVLTFS